jgi:hypothetical protein
LKKQPGTWVTPNFRQGQRKLAIINDGVYTTIAVRQELDILSMGAKSRVQNKQVAIIPDFS